MKKNKTTFELSIKFQNKTAVSEMLTLVLLRLGLRKEDIIEYEHYPYLYLLSYFQNLTRARKVLELLRKQKIKKIQITLKKLSAKKWMTKGAEEFKPFKLTKRLYVIPQKDHRTVMGAKGCKVQSITQEFDVQVKFPDREARDENGILV